MRGGFGITMNDTPSKERSSSNRRTPGWWKPVVLIAIIVLLFILVNLYGFGDRLDSLQTWIHSLGLWGPLAFFFIYLGAVIATIPGTIFGVIAGTLFGSVEGVILISISSTVGACITFLIARYFARDAVAKWLCKNSTMQRLDQLTEDHGFIVVGITRLIPLFPFTLLNYGFGLTKVSFKTYVFWSWLCMIPGTVIVVVGSDAVTQAITQGTIPWILIGVVVIAALILGFVAWFAQRRLHEKRKDNK
jgi:uncharacterized membrane protein YdjX (TVP38/TMEM64 family)